MAETTHKRFYVPRHWTLAQRIDHYTDKSGGPDACWPWIGCKHGGRYGCIWWKGRKHSAHTTAWEIENGRPMNPGHLGCHTCDNMICANPSHVYEGTHADNMADRDKRGRNKNQHGEDCNLAELTTEKVLAIRAAFGTQKEIAARFGATQANVSLIRRGESWRHLLPT